MLIYIISTFLLGALSTVRLAAGAGCWLTLLQSAGPVWFAHLKTCVVCASENGSSEVTARDRPVYRKLFETNAAPDAAGSQKANTVLNEQRFKQGCRCKMVITASKDRGGKYRQNRDRKNEIHRLHRCASRFSAMQVHRDGDA